MPPTKRATLKEHAGLSFTPSARQAHPVDLACWDERGWIKHDLESSCFRLTEAGEERTKSCCAVCVSWKFLDENRGHCWSPERLDDKQKSSAGITREYDTCEAWERA